MARVMIWGASSLVGVALMEKLGHTDHSVIAVSRHQRGNDSVAANTEWRTTDLQDGDQLAQLPSADVVISVLPIWLTAEVFRRSQPSLPGRIIAFSSTSALTKRNSNSQSERQLSERLRAGESAVMETGRATIIRPTMIYGGPENKNIKQIESQLKTFPVFPLVAGGNGMRQPVHAADLAECVWQLLACETSEDKIYEVGGGEILSFRSMVERIGAKAGERFIFLPVPLPLARAALRLLSVLPRFRSIPMESLGRMGNDMVFDNGPAFADFGYAPGRFRP